jgi:4-hydroxybenzoate polyprenyltransferase
MRNRTKILFRLTAFLSLVRWTHILFLATAQVLGALTILDGPGPVPWGTLAGIVVATACIVAGGSLFNSFYDLERDLIERPWRTLLERPVAKKYGMQLAFTFYGGALLAAMLTLSKPVMAATWLYALVVFLYSHKRWGFGAGGALIASFLAFAPLLLVAAALHPSSWPGFLRGLPLAIAMIVLEWRRQWERRQIPTAILGQRPQLKTRQWIYKILLAAGLGLIPFL